MSRPKVADWQYLGVDKYTRRLEWNYERPGRFSSNIEDSFAYVSNSSKDMTKLKTSDITSGGLRRHMITLMEETDDNVHGEDIR